MIKNNKKKWMLNEYQIMNNFFFELIIKKNKKMKLLNNKYKL